VVHALQPDSSRLSRLWHYLARHPEAVAFWALAVAYLVPVWSFRYLPTQDGPSHLANALILRDYGHSAAGYEAFFEVRAEPLPNWTSHLLLTALLYVFPPLVAEKVLVSLYVLGFAGSLRYFFGAFGPRCRPLSWAGLLLVYNHCFWMGFYNYCLSLILFWVILGYCGRRRGALDLSQAFVLMLLFTLQYFTHLVGFLLAVAGALGAMVLLPPRRVLAPLLVVLAALPAACLAMAYFEETGFFRARSAMRVVNQPLARLQGQWAESDIGKDLTALDDELLGYHAGPEIPSGLVLLAFLALLTVVTVADARAGPPDVSDGRGRLFLIVFGLLLLAGYLLVPNHLSFEHGGFLKARLAPLPPLLALACLREPRHEVVRALVRALTVGLLGANLLLVADTIRTGNEEVEEYTAGVEAVGHGHRLFVVQDERARSPLVNPLLHAADYYCLGTANINLDNYEASTPHFPVKYRRGVRRGRDNWSGYAQKDAVDILICWRSSPGPPRHGPDGWEVIFQQGRLCVYRRPGVGQDVTHPENGGG
jgi:hypothetical protein